VQRIGARKNLPKEQAWKMGKWGRGRKGKILCTNFPPVKYPITIQNGGIENLVYRAFHSKLTPALQANARAKHECIQHFSRLQKCILFLEHRKSILYLFRIGYRLVCHFHWIIRCCNIIEFLASTTDGNFSMGSTAFFRNWLLIWITYLKYGICSYHVLMRRNFDPIWFKV